MVLRFPVSEVERREVEPAAPVAAASFGNFRLRFIRLRRRVGGDSRSSKLIRQAAKDDMPTDLLLTLGEIAVAFAGFSGLVVALSRSDGRSEEQAQLDLQLLLNVLSHSFFVVAFALLPPILESMGVAIGVAWRGSSTLLLLTYAPFLFIVGRRSFAAYRKTGRRVPILYAINVWIFGFGSAVLMALVAAGVVPGPTYLGVLGLLLYGAGASFIRVFLSVARGGSAA